MRTGLKLAIVGLLLALIFAAAAIAHDPQLARCVLLKQRELDQFDPNLYVERSISPAERENVRQIVRAARERIDSFLGGRAGNPVIIAGGLDTYRKYGSKGPDFSLTKNTPFDDYIVLGRSGMNVDCLSHEMVHVELRRRLGYLKFAGGAVPTWFDEGAAMYVDYRPAFDELRYQELAQNPGSMPRLADIASRKAFYRSRNPYIVAKHEFAEWFNVYGTEGLLKLLDDVKHGKEFSTVYKNPGEKK